MSDEQDKLKLSLEPPKLFGRKKKSDAGASKRTSPAPTTQNRPESESPAEAEELRAEPDAGTTDEVVEVDEIDDAPTQVVEPVAAEPAAAEPEPEPTATPEATPEPEPEPASAPHKSAEPSRPAAKPAATAATKPAAKTAPAPVTKPAEPAVPGARAKAPTTSGPSKRPARPRAKLAPDIEPEPLPASADDDVDIFADEEPPLLALYPAAAVTGAVVGAAMVVLTWLSLRGCEAIRGAATCGSGPGFVLLVATFVLCILLGSTLLKVFSVPDPGSSSFLAVGLVAVIALLFLIDALDHWSMLIVIPLVGVGGFLASVWVTKTFVEPGELET